MTTAAPKPKPDWRPALPLLAAGLLVSLGTAIPLPGIDPLVFDPDTSAAQPGILARVSILALGLQPFLSVLILFEILRLVVPGWASRIEGVPAGAISIAILALSLAALQATGIADALEGSGVLLDEGVGAISLIVATLVGGVAVHVFLADRIRLPGLPFAGLWFLIALSALAGLPGDTERGIESVRIGMLAPQTLLVTIALFLCAIAAVVFATRALQARIRDAGGDPSVWMPVLLWPPLMTNVVVGPVLLALYELVLPAQLQGLTALALASVALMAVAIPIVVALSARAIARTHPASAGWSGKRPVLLSIALVQIAVVALAQASLFALPFAIGTELIALVVVSLALFDAMRLRAS